MDCGRRKFFPEHSILQENQWRKCDSCRINVEGFIVEDRLSSSSCRLLQSTYQWNLPVVLLKFVSIRVRTVLCYTRNCVSKLIYVE